MGRTKQDNGSTQTTRKKPKLRPGTKRRHRYMGRERRSHKKPLIPYSVMEKIAREVIADAAKQHGIMRRDFRFKRDAIEALRWIVPASVIYVAADARERARLAKHVTVTGSDVASARYAMFEAGIGSILAPRDKKASQGERMSALKAKLRRAEPRPIK